MLSANLGFILFAVIVLDNVRPTFETMPLSFARRLKNVKSNRDMLRLMMSLGTNSQRSMIDDLRLANSLLSTDGRDSSAAVAEFDGCRPRDTPVEIPPDPNPNVFFWPTCVRVSRCGGCCQHMAFDCTPTDRKLADFRVVKMMFDSSGVMPIWSGEVVVRLEAHTACDCACRVLQADCNNKTQHYDADSCSCRCINESLSASCLPPKQWSQHDCACVCPRILNCLDDEYFNYSSCTCQKHTQTQAGSDLKISTLSTSKGTTTPCIRCTSTAIVPNPCYRYHCRPGLKPTNVYGKCHCLPAARRRK